MNQTKDAAEDSEKTPKSKDSGGGSVYFGLALDLLGKICTRLRGTKPNPRTDTKNLAVNPPRFPGLMQVW